MIGDNDYITKLMNKLMILLLTKFSQALKRLNSH